jgi:uncharacterized membrane protein YdjX (TVP38/TMEM64 family)
VIKKFFPWIAAITLLLILARTYDIPGLLRASLNWISQLGPWAPIFFILLYALACVLFIPGSLLTLGAGLLFGVFWGFVYVSLASTTGAVLAFLVGRYLARDWVKKQLEGYPRFKAIDEAVAAQGWKIVGLIRLSPVFPFNLLNYALGLTQVSLKDYTLASWIGMMPATVMYVYIGSLAGNLASLGAGERERSSAEWALYGIGLLATVVVTLYITRIARTALEQRVH